MIYIYIYNDIYVYIYIEREREMETLPRRFSPNSFAPGEKFPAAEDVGPII